MQLESTGLARIIKGLREAVKNVLADFSVKGVPPTPPHPPTPLTDNHFAKKPLAERGGSPPPPLTDNPQKNF